MPRNVEVKAKVTNKEDLINLAREICKEEGTIIDQNDTFFVTEKGRLKLRIFKVIKSVQVIKKKCIHIILIIIPCFI